MMKLPVIYIMTHDSIGVGEDGPTHEPVEQLAALRGIPGFTVIRPCDTNETAAAWALALTRINSPTALALSRQNLTLLPESGKGAFKGAYILRDAVNPKTNEPDILLLASGSEVELIYKAFDILKDEHGLYPRVISFPSFEIFEGQSDEYKESVIPSKVRARLAVEAASPFGWHKYTGLDGGIISVNGFGASGPYAVLFREYGFTVENVVTKALEIVNKKTE
jgi:transketolase